jgi:hypothetical protein
MNWSRYLIIFIFVSCSAVEFKNSSEFPVSFTPRPGHNDQYSHEFVADQYLWGTLPNKIIFDFKQVIDELELNSVASLEIKKDNRLGTYLWPLFTLGFVAPKYFTLKFKGKN